MAKFKPARRGSKPGASARGAVPCIVVLVVGMALLFFLFYAILKQ